MSPEENKGPIAILYGGIDSKRPRHAALIFSTISIWSLIDERTGLVLAQVVRADLRAAYVMWKTIENRQLRWTMLGEVIKEIYGADSREIGWYKALTEICNPARELRNAFAHRLWGIREGDKDSIYLMNPKETQDFMVRAADYQRTKNQDHYEKLKSTELEAEFFTISDLTRIKNQALAIWKLIDDLQAALNSEDSERRQEARARLDLARETQARSRAGNKRKRSGAARRRKKRS